MNCLYFQLQLHSGKPGLVNTLCGCDSGLLAFLQTTSVSFFLVSENLSIREANKIQLSAGDPPSCLFLSASGKSIVIGRKCSVDLFSIVTLPHFPYLQVNLEISHKLFFKPQQVLYSSFNYSSFIFSCGISGVRVIRHPSEGKPLSLHETWSLCQMAVSPNMYLAVVSHDGFLCLTDLKPWILESKPPIYIASCYVSKSRPTSLCFSPNSGLIAVGSWGDNVQIYKLTETKAGHSLIPMNTKYAFVSDKEWTYSAPGVFMEWINGPSDQNERSTLIHSTSSNMELVRNEIVNDQIVDITRISSQSPLKGIAVINKLSVLFSHDQENRLSVAYLPRQPILSGSIVAQSPIGTVRVMIDPLPSNSLTLSVSLTDLGSEKDSSSPSSPMLIASPSCRRANLVRFDSSGCFLPSSSHSIGPNSWKVPCERIRLSKKELVWLSDTGLLYIYSFSSGAWIHFIPPAPTRLISFDCSGRLLLCSQLEMGSKIEKTEERNSPFKVQQDQYTNRVNSQRICVISIWDTEALQPLHSSNIEMPTQLWERAMFMGDQVDDGFGFVFHVEGTIHLWGCQLVEGKIAIQKKVGDGNPEVDLQSLQWVSYNKKEFIFRTESGWWVFDVNKNNFVSSGVPLS